MRIVGGKAKGRRLLSAKGLKTRPTSDKVKESIFNILRLDFEGKEVLDLFAGTGNLGIEALSRGAMSAVFIENNRRAISILERNLNNCNFIDRSEIIESNVALGIKSLENKGLSFDLVFLDPPYEEQFLKGTLVKVSRSKILKDGALVTAEHSHLESIEQHVERLTLVDQRRYGKTLVSFFEVCQ